eukprot:3877844-Amphidinium_carterae.1
MKFGRGWNTEACRNVSCIAVCVFRATHSLHSTRGPVERVVSMQTGPLKVHFPCRRAERVQAMQSFGHSRHLQSEQKPSHYSSI